MTDNEIEIAGLLDNINDSIKVMQANNVEPESVPGTFSMMFSGANNNAIMKFIFSSNLDKLLDQLFDMLMCGDFEDIINKSNDIEDMFNKFAVGSTKIFSSTVSKQFVANMKEAVNSKKFQKAKTNLSRAWTLIKQLKQKAKQIDNEAMRKKYEDTVYAFKKILKIMASIYGSRKNINLRVQSGIRNLLSESEDRSLYEYGLVNYLEQ